MPVDLPFDRYLPYADLTNCLRLLVEEYPHLLLMHSIGQSHQGRDVWLMTLTNQQTGPDHEKPAFWVDGNIHATEVSAASACLYLLKYLLEGYGSSPEITRCLDTRVLYVAPRINPDGAELYFADTPRFLRSSVRPYPYDEDPIDGLKRCDIDGDGRFLTMRLVDPNGAWKVSPEEPRLLVRREPAETGGTYYRLLPEGELENWDGVTLNVQNNKEGLDLNRNFPSNWRQEHEQTGAGPFPTSEPEVRNVAAFIAEHPNITGGITFHTFSGVLLRPYGTQADETMPAEDLWTFQKIGGKGTEITGYPAISVYHDFRYHPKEVITGVFDDWLYEHLGLFAWTVEIWSPQREAGIEEMKYIDWYREHPHADDLKMLQWSDTVLEGKGYIDWYPFKHPQLGEVELGGWDAMYAFRNPPPPFLEREVAKFPRWVLWHTLISPLLQLHSLVVEPLGANVWKIRAVIENVGWLPTNVSRKALEKKAVRGVVAEITLPEGALLKTGRPREDLGQLEGRSHKECAPVVWTQDPTDNRAKVEWTVCCPAESTAGIKFHHPRAGTVRTQAVLSA
jgi:murein tripeptide amidase MpaA